MLTPGLKVQPMSSASRGFTHIQMNQDARLTTAAQSVQS
jgi:hypothetical protein